MNEKIKAARLSIASNTVLTLGKLAVGLSMNSIGVISEAVHSGLDLAAALIAFFSVREASKPADDLHLYGHGKFENLASIIESLLIIAAGVMIILNALPKLRQGSEIQSLGLGAAVMAVSAAVNWLVSGKLMKVARQTESPALAADAWHLRTDVYTSLGVFAGIGVIYLTGNTIFDPIAALCVAVLIFKAAYDLIRDSLCSILDVRLPEAEEEKIRDVLKQHSAGFVEYHKLRTRKSGSERYIDLHLVVPRSSPIKKVHTLCEHIEEDMRCQLPGVHVLIHTEPCGKYCEECAVPEESCKPPQQRHPDCAACKDCGKKGAT